MIACAGIIQLLAILWQKYVTRPPDNYRIIALGDIFYFIFGTLTNHSIIFILKKITSCNVSQLCQQMLVYQTVPDLWE